MARNAPPSGFRSDTSKLFLSRLWFPFLIVCGVLGIFWGNWKGVWIASPLIAGAAFLLSLAEVRAEAGVLRYRRFLRWKEIGYDEISKCGTAWPPFVGFLKLQDFILPWGRVYFVLDGSLFENPFRGSESELMRHILGTMQRAENSESITKTEHKAPRHLIVSGLLAGSLGVLVSLMTTLLFPGLAQFHARETDFPRWVVIYDQLRTIVFGWPWNLLVFALFVLAAARSRPQGAWVFAFVAGLLLPSIVFGWR